MRRRFSLILLFILLSCKGNKAEDSIYLIPEGYEGRVFIIYGSEKFGNVKYENGKRLYKIPPSGILKTSFEPNLGKSKLFEFYSYDLDNDSNRNRLKYSFSIKNSTTKNTDSLIVSGMELGRYKGFSFKMFHVRNISNTSEINKKPFFVADSLEKISFEKK